MSTLQTTQAQILNTPVSTLRNWYHRMWSFNKALAISALLYLVVLPIYLVAAIFDQQLVTNAPAFIKPLKFIISVGIYVVTFYWLLTLVQGRQRWVQIAADVTAIGLLIEMALITMQALRGIASHFNNTTPMDAGIFSIMGITIMLVALMDLLLGIWLLFQRLPDPVLAWSVRFGVFISFAGMLVAVLMVGHPTPGQRAQIEAGLEPAAIGAHSVGVEDGGPGLPFVGWSTVGGDLRVPHFIGLHAMQALPLIGFVLSRRRNLNLRQRLTLIGTAGVAYSGLLALLTWQALRGQPVIAPDMLTLSAYTGLLGFVILGATVAFTLLHQSEAVAVNAQ
jgi:hypothetical protein